MKHLGDFNFFDWVNFAKDKTFEVLSCTQWKDDKGVPQGTKVEVVIKEDKTRYLLREGETNVTNVYEKLIFKVSEDRGIMHVIDPGSIVVPVNVKATIYGDYRNNLSVKCDRVDIIKPVKNESEKVDTKK